MFQSIFRHYFDTIPAASILPLGFKVVAPYDYHLYFCEFRGRQYVVIEIDYLSGLPSIVKDAEQVFSVVAIGWCVLVKHQKEVGQNFLPPDVDDHDPDGTSEQSHKNYQSVVTEVHGMRYAVLAVKPHE